MRTLVDLPEQHLLQLTRLAKRRAVSRAQLMREAVADYLQHQPTARTPNDWVAAGAGVLAERPLSLDGVDYPEALDYERALRDEWQAPRSVSAHRPAAPRKARR